MNILATIAVVTVRSFIQRFREVGNAVFERNGNNPLLKIRLLKLMTKRRIYISMWT